MYSVIQDHFHELYEGRFDAGAPMRGYFSLKELARLRAQLRLNRRTHTNHTSHTSQPTQPSTPSDQDININPFSDDARAEDQSLDKPLARLL